MNGSSNDSAGSLRALHVIEARWRAILDTARDGIISIDCRGRIELFNHSAEKIFGLSASEVLGRNVSCLMPSPYREEHDDYLEHYERTGEARAIGRVRDVFGQRGNGEKFPLELSVSRTEVAGEVHYMAVVRDVTERHRADQAIRQSQARFDAFMRNTSAIAFMKDEHGRYLYVNPPAEVAFGRPASEVLGRTDYDLWPEEVAAVLRANDRAVLATGRPAEILESLPDAEGNRTDWLTFKFPLSELEERRSLGGMAVDISPRIRAEERLRETEKIFQERQRLADVGAVTAKIVHDLGNPIGGLSMQAQLILRRATRDPNVSLGTIVDSATKLTAEVRRLEALLRELATASRERRLDLQPVDLATLLENAVALWRPVAEARSVLLALDVQQLIPPLDADAAQLRRVLDNLIKNAVEAVADEGGIVTVSLTRPAVDRVRISVTDTGPGVVDGVQVFGLFETTKPEGSGLGLAISRQIVHAHGGEITWSPVEPHGARFDVELPRLTARADT